MIQESGNVLAIDTATPVLRLALRYGSDRMVQSEEKMEHSHARMLARKIDGLLESCGLTKKEIGAIVVNRGPGSFTGLRIGIAAARGISLALSRPLVAVSMFEIVASRFCEHDGSITVVAPFKRDACVVSVVTSGHWQRETMRVFDLSAGLDEKFAEAARVIAIGYDREMLPPSLLSGSKIEFIEYDAGDLIPAGEGKLSHGAKGGTRITDELEPVYAQPSQAEINLAKRGR